VLTVCETLPVTERDDDGEPDEVAVRAFENERESVIVGHEEPLEVGDAVAQRDDDDDTDTVGETDRERVGDVVTDGERE